MCPAQENVVLTADSLLSHFIEVTSVDNTLDASNQNNVRCSLFRALLFTKHSVTMYMLHMDKLNHCELIHSQNEGVEKKEKGRKRHECSGTCNRKRIVPLPLVSNLNRFLLAPGRWCKRTCMRSLISEILSKIGLLHRLHGECQRLRSKWGSRSRMNEIYWKTGLIMVKELSLDEQINYSFWLESKLCLLFRLFIHLVQW